MKKTKTKMEKRKAQAKGIKARIDEKGKKTLAKLGNLLGRPASPTTRSSKKGPARTAPTTKGVKKGPATRTAISMKKSSTKTMISERPVSGTRVSMKPTKRKPKPVEITPKDIEKMKKGKFILISPKGRRYYYNDIKAELETGKESWKFKRLNEKGKNLTIFGVVKGRLNKGYKMFPPPGAVPKKKEPKKLKRIIVSPKKGEAQKKADEFCSALDSKKPVFSYGSKGKERNLFMDLPAHTKEIQEQWKGMILVEKSEFKKKLSIYFSAAGSGKVGVKTLANLIDLTMRKNRHLKNVWTALKETRNWRVVGAQWKRAYIYNKILKEYKEAPKPPVEKKAVEKKPKVKEEKEKKKPEKKRPEKKKPPKVDTISGAAPIVKKKDALPPKNVKISKKIQKAVDKLEEKLEGEDKKEVTTALKKIISEHWEGSLQMKDLAKELLNELKEGLPKKEYDELAEKFHHRGYVSVIHAYWNNLHPKPVLKKEKPAKPEEKLDVEEAVSVDEEAEPVIGDEGFDLSEGA
ncbi:hypothetical protein KAW38_01905 [Candidatus Micrarchaeota archaeon]|nr:hypothetical protein [Candidatus Micrarchaeota archaeon]